MCHLITKVALSVFNRGRQPEQTMFNATATRVQGRACPHQHAKIACMAPVHCTTSHIQRARQRAARAQGRARSPERPCG